MARKAGEGDVRKRGENSYIWQGTIVLWNGEKKRVSASGKTPKEVLTKKRKILSDAKQGKPTAQKRFTLQEWSELWLSQYKKIELSPKTLNDYRIFFKYHINPTIGKLKLKELTTLDIQTLITKTVNKLAPSSVKKMHVVLKSCIEQAFREGHVESNVANHVRLPRQPKSRRRKVLSNEDLAKIISIAYAEHIKEEKSVNKTFYPALIIAIETGIRRSELLGLKWPSVNFENNIVFIHEALVEAPSKPIHKDELKNESSVRHLPLSDEAMELLAAIVRNSEFVFSTKKGQPINPRNWNRKFHHWCTKAGIDFSLHDLRHTFITDMINAGESITSIQGFTGHANPTVLLNHYAHIVTEEKMNAAKRKHERMKVLYPNAIAKQDN